MSTSMTWSSSADGRISPPRRIVRFVRRWLNELREERSWRRAGCPAPAPGHVKRALLRGHALRHGARVFVETGTLYGDTLAAMRTFFDQLHSVELDPRLYQQAVQRFTNDSRIRLWRGDSGSVLPRVLDGIDQPTLFWLDGHYSGPGTAQGTADTPIRLELEHIGRHALCGSHLVIIDDARLFDGTNGYPTVNEFRARAAALGFIYMREEHDMILLSTRPIAVNPSTPTWKRYLRWIPGARAMWRNGRKGFFFSIIYVTSPAFLHSPRRPVGPFRGGRTGGPSLERKRLKRHLTVIMFIILHGRLGYWREADRLGISTFLQPSISLG